MRTDRTVLCAACCLRFPAAPRCPRCQDDQVFDLTRPASRRRALEVLARGPQTKRPAFEGGILAFLGLVTAGAAIAGGASLHRLGLTYVQATVSALVLWSTFLTTLPLLGGFLHLVFEVLGVLTRLARLGWKAPSLHVLPTDEQDLLDGPRPARISGVVRVVQPFESPLSHRPCVATRLFGDGPFGPIDDVCAIPFDVVTEDGERIRVSPAHASVDLESDAVPRVVRPDRELLAFLEDRGVFPRKGVVSLAEALLVEGERVVIEGHLGEPRSEPGRTSHYRESAATRVLTARSGVPLVIRRSLRDGGPARER